MIDARSPEAPLTETASQPPSLLRVPSFAPALLAILFAILAEAMGGSYMALLAVQKVGMTPLQLTAFLTVGAVSGIVATTLFGHLHDRRPRLWPLYASLVAKILGFLVAAVATEPWMLIANAAVIFGLSSASFALLFAMAKGYLDQVGGIAVARGMAALRLASSLSWAVGPALGALFVSLWSFAGVFVGAALLGLAALATVMVSRLRVVPQEAASRRRFDLSAVMDMAPAALALTAFHTAMFMGSNAMSIVVGQQLGSEADVGWLFSLCAALEVVVMAVFVIRPQARASRGLLAFGFALFAGYFVLAFVWPTLLSLYVGQVLRAAGIGIVSIVGMAFVQERLPGRAGAASALFGNSVSAGAVLSGIGTGVLGASFGYWSIFLVCAGFCVLGGLAFLIGGKRD